MLSVIGSAPWQVFAAGAAQPLDLGPARGIAEAIIRRGGNKDGMERSIDRALLFAYGTWVAGWHWATSEPGGGGPVGAWCCAGHSLLRAGEEQSASVDRVAASVEEWHGFLGELSVEFTDIRKQTTGLAVEEQVEFAAARLAPLVIARTHCEDAWYATVSIVIGWYLDFVGLGDARGEVHRVMSGRFTSWVGPGDRELSDACAEIGLAVGGHEPARVEDSLELWRQTRAKGIGANPAISRSTLPTPDAHRAYIDRVDAARDPERAERMHAALDACHASAVAGETLTFAVLARWQQLVLGLDAPPPLRTEDAFAREGRVRYGPVSVGEIDAWLAEASGTGHVGLLAARVYLDVCFAHPFADGNARAARLALDYVLTRQQLSLRAAEPLFWIARSARDDLGAWRFAYAVGYLVGPSL